MFDGWNIVLLGVMGVVGEVLLELLNECQFLVGELYFLVSECSVGVIVCFNGKSVLVENVVEFDWLQV